MNSKIYFLSTDLIYEKKIVKKSYKCKKICDLLSQIYISIKMNLVYNIVE